MRHRWRLAHPEAARAIQRAHYLRHRARYLARAACQRVTEPERVRARLAVSNALRAGLLTRAPCEVCGARAQAHHEDYRRPLDVRWFCPTHHRRHHSKPRLEL